MRLLQEALDILVLKQTSQFRSFGAISSLRSVAGLEDVLVESCGGNVEDETPPELVDNPGTTKGTKVSVLHVIGISVVFAECSKR